MKIITRLGNVLLSKRVFCVPHRSTSICEISTSNKKDDTTTVVGPTTISDQSTTATTQNVSKTKFFYTFGFGGKTEEEEHNIMHSVFFLYMTLVVVGLGFYFKYRPETNLKGWARREAYLELRRREKLGLPLIDPNYVDPATVYLPSDEELGDTEIII